MFGVLGHRWDTDGNASLEWQWLAYDDRWRAVARFEDRGAATEPFEQIYHHHAGLAGQGGSSYFDLVICRDRDADADTANGMEERSYVLQNWRADVIALAAADGDLLERVSYDPYGIPFATHPTDLTFGATSGVSGYGMPNGTVNGDDYSYFLALYGASDWRADWNRDGTLDAADNTAYLADKAAASGSWGRGVLSNRSNILGYAGYVHEPATGAAGGGHGTMYHCRLRVYHAGLGRWIQRDPPQYEYGEGMSLYWYAGNRPITMSDWVGGPMCPGASPTLGYCIGSGAPPAMPEPPLNQNPRLIPGPWTSSPWYLPPCVDQALRDDPEIGQAFLDAATACSGSGGPPVVQCQPCTTCANTDCTNPPTITICTSAPAGCGSQKDTLLHELRHAVQCCTLGPVPPCSDIANSLCREIDAH